MQSFMVNGNELNDGIRSKISFTKSDLGLVKPLKPVSKSFKGGSFIQLPDAAAYDINKQGKIIGKLINQGGFWTKEQVLEILQQSFDIRGGYIQYGSLKRQVASFNPKIIDDNYRKLANIVTFEVDFESIGPWIPVDGGYRLGVAQDILVQDNSFSNKFFTTSSSNNQISFNNIGSASTYLQMKIWGLTASTTYYIRVVPPIGAPNLASFTTDTTGLLTIPIGARLPLKPGISTIRLEDSTGAITGPASCVFDLWDTQIQFLGNNADRFEDSPLVFVPFRTGGATYLEVDGIIATADGQARIGVPCGIYSGANTGLVLEQVGTNYLLYSQAIDNGVWIKGTGVAVGAIDAVAAPDGTMTADRVDFSPGGTILWQAVTVPGSGATFTSSIWVKAYSAGDAGKTIILQNSQTGPSTSYVLTTSWQQIFLTTAAKLTTSGLQLSMSGGIGCSVYVWGGQVEGFPFATSYIPTNGVVASRNADLCALANPSNLLQWSQDFTQAAWTNSGQSVTGNSTTAPDGTTTAALVTLTNNVYNQYTQQQTTNTAAGKTYTFSVWLKMDNYAYVRLKIGSSSTTAESNDCILTTSWQRFEFTYSFASNATGNVFVQINIDNNVSGQTIYAWGAQLEEGSFPGRYVATQGSPLYPDASGWTWPGGQWTQNGFIEFTVVAPLPNSITFDLFSGDISGAVLKLWHYGPASPYDLVYDRYCNVSGRTVIEIYTNPGIWDGNAHTVKLQWQNYTLNGAQVMSTSLYIDGALVGTSTPPAGATAWIAGENLALSNGSAFATISNVILGFPALPAGAIPYTA